MSLGCSIRNLDQLQKACRLQGSTETPSYIWSHIVLLDAWIITFMAQPKQQIQDLLLPVLDPILIATDYDPKRWVWYPKQLQIPRSQHGCVVCKKQMPRGILAPMPTWKCCPQRDDSTWKRYDNVTDTGGDTGFWAKLLCWIQLQTIEFCTNTRMSPPAWWNHVQATLSCWGLHFRFY